MLTVSTCERQSRFEYLLRSLVLWNVGTNDALRYFLLKKLELLRELARWSGFNRARHWMHSRGWRAKHNAPLSFAGDSRIGSRKPFDFLLEKLHIYLNQVTVKYINVSFLILNKLGCSKVKWINEYLKNFSSMIVKCSVLAVLYNF